MFNLPQRQRSARAPRQSRTPLLEQNALIPGRYTGVFVNVQDFRFDRETVSVLIRAMLPYILIHRLALKAQAQKRNDTGMLLRDLTTPTETCRE